MEDEDKIIDEEELEDEEIDFDELNHLLASTFGESYSVESAIEISKQEKSQIKESFKITNSNCNKTYILGNMTLLKLKLMEFEAYFAKLVSIVFQNGQLEIADDLIKKIKYTQEEYKKLNKRLLNIKLSLLKLKKYNSPLCNSEINYLIKCIYDKGFILLDILDNYIQMCRLSTKGINFLGTNKSQESLEDINQKIDESIKTLGLSIKTYGDKQ